jgi:hypothetical protein
MRQASVANCVDQVHMKHLKLQSFKISESIVGPQSVVVNNKVGVV